MIEIGLERYYTEPGPVPRELLGEFFEKGECLGDGHFEDVVDRPIAVPDIKDLALESFPAALVASARGKDDDQEAAAAADEGQADAARN